MKRTKQKHPECILMVSFLSFRVPTSRAVEFLPLAFTLTLSLGGLLAAPTAGLGQSGGSNRAGIEATRVQQLVQVLRVDLDERKRKAAVVELGRIDLRIHPEAVQCLIVAIQN